MAKRSNCGCSEQIQIKVEKRVSPSRRNQKVYTEVLEHHIDQQIPHFADKVYNHRGKSMLKLLHEHYLICFDTFGRIEQALPCTFNRRKLGGDVGISP